MTVVTYPVGRPRPAAQRGGDCRARDLDQDRNVYGPHIFAAPTYCQVCNGALRLTVTASVIPELLVEVRRPPVVTGDVYDDIYSDTYVGTIDPAAWAAAGTVRFDAPLLGAALDGVSLDRVTPEIVSIRLSARVMGDVHVVLRQGERSARIQHGSSRLATTTSRTVRWLASPSPVGVANTSRVEEATPVVPSLLRYVASVAPATVDAANFAVTVAATSARFGFGLGTDAGRDRPISHHRQLTDASGSVVVVD